MISHEEFIKIHDEKIERAIREAEKAQSKASKEFKHDVYNKVLDYWLYFGKR